MVICVRVFIITAYCFSSFIIQKGCYGEKEKFHANDVSTRWHEVEHEIISISGRISKLSQAITWKVYRKIDQVQLDLEQANQSFTMLGQELSALSKLAWLCAVEMQNTNQQSQKTDKAWKKCLHKLANDVAGKEKELSTLNNKLRAVALPCYFKLDCHQNFTKIYNAQLKGNTCVGFGCWNYKWKDSYGCCKPENALTAIDNILDKGKQIEDWINNSANNLEDNIDSCLEDMSKSINIIYKNKANLEKCKSL